MVTTWTSFFFMVAQTRKQKQQQKLSSKISQQTWKVLELEEFGQMIEYADDFLDDFLKFIQVLGGSDPEFKETHAITTQQTPGPSFNSLLTHFLFSFVLKEKKNVQQCSDQRHSW